MKLLEQIFENEPKEQVATRIEFSGAFENPEIGVWEAAVSFIRNAFVRALKPGLGPEDDARYPGTPESQSRLASVANRRRVEGARHCERSEAISCRTT